jgi:hypothetical protein
MTAITRPSGTGVAAGPIGGPIGTVVTFAVGRPVYAELAVNFARSFLHWNRDSGLELLIVTDCEPVPAPDLRGVRWHRLPEGDTRGFAAKLEMDRLVPPRPTLFIDVDCLVTGSLLPLFRRWAGKPWALPGRAERTGHFYADIPPLLARTGLPWLPVFVSSVLYWEPGPVASQVFGTARSLLPHYDELGLQRLRGLESDEPLIALAMATHGITPVEDDGSVKADAHLFDFPPQIDVLGGRVWFRNRDPSAAGRVIRNPLTDARPLVAHFNSTYAFQSPYRREAMILRLVHARAWPAPLARAAARLVVDVPAGLATGTKRLLRPIFHRLFGVRRIRPSARET